MQVILAGGQGDIDAEDSTRMALGARGAVARMIYQENLKAQPGDFPKVMCTLLARARRKELHQLMPQDLLTFFEEQSPLGYSKTLTYFAYLLSAMWEALETQQSAEEKVTAMQNLVARSAVFVDQSASEGGNQYQLAWLLTGLEELNWAAVQARANYRHQVGLISRLADPRAVAVNQAYLRELKTVEDRLQQGYQRTGNHKEKEETEKQIEERQKKAAAKKAAAAKKKEGANQG